jgi:hypothetical protein
MSSVPVTAEPAEVPASCICPITGEPMRDPVVDREGNTYERAAIVDWLRRNPTSPITRNPLSVHDLVPNRAVRDLVIEHLGSAFATLTAADAAAPAAASGFRCTVTLVSEPAEDARVTSTGNVWAVASILSDDSMERAPVDICAVVDVSGTRAA